MRGVAFGAEIAIILLSYLITGLVIETNFLFLTGMTAVALTIFFIEGVLLQRKVST
jgi:hypothetical protein